MLSGDTLIEQNANFLRDMYPANEKAKAQSSDAISLKSPEDVSRSNILLFRNKCLEEWVATGLPFGCLAKEMPCENSFSFIEEVFDNQA